MHDSWRMGGQRTLDECTRHIDIAEQVVVSPKKGRVAAGGVADLMEQLKPKAKKRGKAKGGGKRGGGSPIMQ
ncbi:hypothetical protein V6N13_134515 [Hibiscus sabdariffa]